MKNFFTLILSLFAFSVFGQALEIQPSNTMVYEYTADEFTGEAIYVLNISDEAISLEYEVLSNTFFEEWNCTLCAGENCDPFIPETGDLGIVQPEETTFFSFGMSFNGQAGEGTIEIRVFDPSNVDISETFTLTYIVGEATTSAKDLSNYYQFNVGPNPVQDYVMVQSDLLQNYEVELYNNLGQLVMIQQVAGNLGMIQIAGQAAGLYTLVVRSEEDVVYLKRLSKK